MMRCYFYRQKQLSNETSMITKSEEGRGSDGEHKGQRGIRRVKGAEMKREDYLQKFVSEIAESLEA